MKRVGFRMLYLLFTLLISFSFSYGMERTSNVTYVGHIIIVEDVQKPDSKVPEKEVPQEEMKEVIVEEKEEEKKKYEDTIIEQHDTTEEKEKIIEMKDDVFKETENTKEEIVDEIIKVEKEEVIFKKKEENKGIQETSSKTTSEKKEVNDIKEDSKKHANIIEKIEEIFKGPDPVLISEVENIEDSNAQDKDSKTTVENKKENVIERLIHKKKRIDINGKKYTKSIDKNDEYEVTLNDKSETSHNYLKNINLKRYIYISPIIIIFSYLFIISGSKYRKD